MTAFFGTERNTVEPRISIVVPALNEALNLSVVLPQLPGVHEVILVDGGSVDGTVMAARRALPDVITVLQARRGKGNALAAGFARVTGDIVVMFDADGSADPAEITRFVEALKSGGTSPRARASSRWRLGRHHPDPPPRQRVPQRHLQHRLWTRYSDLCYGYNAFWADLLPLLDLPDNKTLPRPTARCRGATASIETVINCRFAAAGISIAEVPSVERLRMFGESYLRAVHDGFRILSPVHRVRRARSSAGWTASSPEPHGCPACSAPEWPPDPGSLDSLDGSGATR